jgi:pilus assembly protein FimV
MRRKLTAAIFAVSTLTSGLVHALGLGEATVRSSLNQPLNAEIELLSVNELTEREIITALASREDFLRANVERTYFLSDVRFKVEMKPGGGAFIKITSARPVREPYLNFLLEVNWPTGRLLREYALLIDPPTFSSEAPAPVVAAASSVSPQVSSTQAPSGRQPPVASARTTSTGSTRVTGGQYGPVARNDTLWSVAMQTKPVDDVTAQQMMLALQDANPNAFLDNNINRLKAGQMLNVPDEAQIKARTAREAVVQVSAQNRAFAEGSSPDTRKAEALPERRSGDLTAVRPGKTQDQLRIVVDSDVGQEGGSAAISGKVSAATGGTAELAVAQERLDKSERDKTDLQGRVGELEEQLETLQRLMSLKDEQLAALQVRLADAGQEVSLPEVSGTVTDASAVQAGAIEAVVEPASVDVASLSSPGVDDSSGVAGPQIVEEAATVAGTVPESTDSAAKTAQVVEEKPVIKSRDKAEVEVKEDNWFTIIKENPIYQAALAAGGVVLLLILWLLSRSSAKKEHDFLERQNDKSEDGDKLFEGLDFQNKSASKAMSGEASAPLAEADVYIAYKRYDQASKVLREAAEQQPDNAEIRLKLLEVAGETKDRPLFDRTAAALLALGVPAVTAQVTRLRADYEAALDEDGLSLDDLENQLLSGNLPEQKGIAEDLDIDAIPAVGSVGASTANLDEYEEDNLDIDFDLGDIDLNETVNASEADSRTPLTTSLFGAQADAAGGLEEEIANELELDSQPTNTSRHDADELDATLEQGLDDDFDLGRIEESEAVEEEFGGELGELKDDLSDELRDLEESVDKAPDSLEVSLEEELSLDLDDADLDFTVSSATDLESSLNDLDLEIDQVEERVQGSVAEAAEVTTADFSDEITDSASVAGLNEEPDVALDEDFLGSVDTTTIDPAPEIRAAKAPVSGLQDEFVDDLEEDFEFLAGTDEAATKLDLARAYIDMGDKEGARDILEEVLEEGNGQQKQDAAKLIEGLS